MDDRFPLAFLVLIVIFTVTILVVSVAGIWEDTDPTGESEPELPPVESDDQPKTPSDMRTVPPGTAESSDPANDPAPSTTKVCVTWERLDATRRTTDRNPDAVWSGSPFDPPALPEVHGTIRARTSGPDSGVVEARVVHGSPLRFEVKRVAGSSTESVIEYRGRGLHARIIQLGTGSGVRVRRFLQPRGLGGAVVGMELTAPGRLEGTVTDRNDRPVSGAAVRVDATITTTDARGRFRLTGVRGRRVPVNVTAPRYAPHRAIVEVPEGFGTERAAEFSPVIRLHPAVRLEVRVRFPTGFEQRGPGFRFYLIPFGHRLALDTLAVETQGPLHTGASATLVVPDFPTGQDMCLVGIHPEMDLLYRRLRAGDADLRIELSARTRIEVKGTVTRRKDGRSVPDFRLDTPLDTLTIGEYLVGRRQIPGGQEPGNFPLPALPLPMLEHEADGKGSFRASFDSGVRHGVRLRFRAPGFRTRIVPSGGLHPGLEVRLGGVDDPAGPGASIVLAIRLAGQPTVEAFTCDGLDPVARPVIERGRVRAVLGGVPLGKYRVRVEAPGYAEYTRTLTLNAATPRRVSVFLAVR